MVMYAKIRRMYYREHLSINEIQRRTSLSRNTIKKWLRAPGDSAVKYQRVKKPGKLTPFESRVLLALEVDIRRPRKDRRTAMMLYEEIRKDGYVGGYTILCDFIRNWHNQGGQRKLAYVPLKFILGEAFQFDWSEEWLVIGGIHRKVLAAHTKLCANRAFMLSGYPSQSHEMLFDAHTRAFTAFGGIPKRGIYDNMNDRNLLCEHFCPPAVPRFDPHVDGNEFHHRHSHPNYWFGHFMADATVDRCTAFPILLIQLVHDDGLAHAHRFSDRNSDADGQQFHRLAQRHLDTGATVFTATL